MQDLLNLPWEIHVVLASGYLGYTFGFCGRREHHSGADTLMLTLVFGLISYLAFMTAEAVLDLLPLGEVVNTILQALFALVTGACAGLIWQRGGWNKMFNLLRDKGLSIEDGSPTAWRSILDREDEAGKTQLFVELTNGKTYGCDELGRFEGLPYGPCLLGPDGSVAMYVNSITRANGETIESAQEDIHDAQWGNLFTYFPASQIANIEMRLVK